MPRIGWKLLPLPPSSSTSWYMYYIVPRKDFPNHYHHLCFSCNTGWWSGIPNSLLFILTPWKLEKSCKLIALQVDNWKYGLLLPKNISPFQLCLSSLCFSNLRLIIGCLDPSYEIKDFFLWMERGSNLGELLEYCTEISSILLII